MVSIGLEMKISLFHCVWFLDAKYQMSCKQAVVFKGRENLKIASYEVSKIIAVKMKLHTLAELFCLHAKRRLKLLDDEEKEISKILLLNDTVHRRILEITNDIEENVLQNSYFALKDDESTDINKVILLAFIPFIDRDRIVHHFVCCKEFLTTTKGEDIFFLF